VKIVAGKFLFITLVIASWLQTIDTVCAQEKIRIAWSGASPANAAVWVLQEKRLLQKYGVDPEIIAISASPIVLQALLAGEIDVAATSVATLVSSRLAGADTVMILGMVRTFVDHIITAQNITSPEQLKGKIGGGNPERFAALSKGVINFTIIPEPFVRQALQLGFRDLFDIGSLKIPFWWNSVLSREAIVKAKRPLLLKFARAMIEAIHFNKTHKEESKAIWGKYLKVSDQEGLERAWHAYTAAYPDNLLPTPEGVKTALDDLAPRDPRAAAADARTFVDPSLVREIEATGFVKQLYKK
jgi:ABC-type nitrate/sulfonate/bicarbonate transport system substrate-binding protein